MTPVFLSHHLTSSTPTPSDHGDDHNSSISESLDRKQSIASNMNMTGGGGGGSSSKSPRFPPNFFANHPSQHHHHIEEEDENDLSDSASSQFDAMPGSSGGDSSSGVVQQHAPSRMRPSSVRSTANSKAAQKAAAEKPHHKRTPHLAVGLSIIYGMFLFLFGILLSLDTFAGKLGERRIVNTVRCDFVVVGRLQAYWNSKKARLNGISVSRLSFSLKS